MNLLLLAAANAAIGVVRSALVAAARAVREAVEGAEDEKAALRAQAAGVVVALQTVEEETRLLEKRLSRLFVEAGAAERGGGR